MGGGIFDEYKIRFNCFKDVPFSILFGGSVNYYHILFGPSSSHTNFGHICNTPPPHPLKAYRSPLHYSWEKGDDSCDGEGEGR